MSDKNTSDHHVRLDELDKNEWRDVWRKVRPDWTDADFEKAWAEFVKVKLKYQQQ